jgi:hypothetical protein
MPSQGLAANGQGGVENVLDIMRSGIRRLGDPAATLSPAS